MAKNGNSSRSKSGRGGNSRSGRKDRNDRTSGAARKSGGSSAAGRTARSGGSSRSASSASSRSGAKAPAKSSRASAPRRSGAGGASSGRSAAGGTDALDLLKAQHREVEGLFKQFERAENDNECFEVAQLICQKLTVHATIEEELLYPRARSQGQGADGGDSESELKDKVLEALEEHLSAKRLIADIQGLEAGDERLEAKISVLKEQVSHHVDEEEDEMFPSVRKEIPKEERRELGQQLMQRTEELEMAAEGEQGAGAAMAAAAGDDLDGDEGSQAANGTGIDAGAQRSSGGRSARAGATHHHH